MKCAAQIVFNNLNYQRPAIAFNINAGATAIRPNGTIYRYGYEEWNEQELFLKNQIA